jgi:hypothetical protein
MEWVNQPAFLEDFPVAIFGMMWFLSAAFIFILLPILREARSRNNLLASPMKLIIRLIPLALMARMWAGILIDQMPCFLGVPFCD